MSVDGKTGAEEVKSSEARDHFSDLVSRVGFGGERFVISRHNKALAALVSYEDMELLERIENEKIIRRSRQARREEEPMPWEEAKKELGK